MNNSIRCWIYIRIIYTCISSVKGLSVYLHRGYRNKRMYALTMFTSLVFIPPMAIKFASTFLVSFSWGFIMSGWGWALAATILHSFSFFLIRFLYPRYARLIRTYTPIRFCAISEWNWAQKELMRCGRWCWPWPTRKEG